MKDIYNIVLFNRLDFVQRLINEFGLDNNDIKIIAMRCCRLGSTEIMRYNGLNIHLPSQKRNREGGFDMVSDSLISIDGLLL